MLVALGEPMNRCEIVVGDALEVLRAMPDDSVQCCVTSPPYWALRDYGVPGQLGLEPTFGEYLTRLVAIFEEVRRVLRKDGTCWVNMGDSYAGGGNNSGNTKEISEKQGSNRGNRFEKKAIPDGLKAKDLIGQPWRLAFALQDAGWWLRSDIPQVQVWVCPCGCGERMVLERQWDGAVVWEKPNPMPESVTDRPTKAHEYIFLLTKSARYYYDAAAIAEPLAPKTYTTFGCGPGTPKGNDALGGVKADNWARSVAVHKPKDWAGRADKQSGHGRRHAGFNERWDKSESNGTAPLMRNARSVWTIATSPFPEAHFATFPPELPRRCILAGSKPGDLVLDPFSGAGTTGLVSNRLGRDFVGIELNPKYAAMARRRIAADAPLFNERSET